MTVEMKCMQFPPNLHLFLPTALARLKRLTLARRKASCRKHGTPTLYGRNCVAHPQLVVRSSLCDPCHPLQSHFQPPRECQEVRNRHQDPQNHGR